ncbi:MAG: PQQ-dependent sugar dehydrogenase [Vicinamibacterales bacterium]
MIREAAMPIPQMTRRRSTSGRKRGGPAALITGVVLASALLTAQTDRLPEMAADRIASPPTQKRLDAGPWFLDTFEYRIRVVRLATLDRPWSIAFLPDGAMLVTERRGRLRIIRNGTLDPAPIPGAPAVLIRGLDGLLDIALHPSFAENRFVYLTYSKPDPDGSVQTALYRARFDGKALVEGRDVFVANTPIPRTRPQSLTSRMAFGRDGMIYMTVGASDADRLKAQDPSSHRGKIVRLRDDGTVPPDNPFIGKNQFGLRYMPEIFSMGHRNAMGLAINPETGELWENENGPMGGDEINIIRAGRNYGWPFISMGRQYDGTPFPPAMDGMEQPHVHWFPNPAVSGMTFYTGDVFPKWKRNVFVGGLGGTRVERLAFTPQWEPIGVKGALGSEPLLFDLRQRIRDVRQGPDGLLYVLTDETDGAVLRIEPADVPSRAASAAAPSQEGSDTRGVVGARR